MVPGSLRRPLRNCRLPCTESAGDVLRAVGELGRTAREHITRVQGPGEIRCAVFERIAPSRPRAGGR